jgi:hypothetical protein
MPGEKSPGLFLWGRPSAEFDQGGKALDGSAHGLAPSFTFSSWNQFST